MNSPLSWPPRPRPRRESAPVPAVASGTLLDEIELAALDARLRRQEELPSSLKGVLVRKVPDTATAHEAGLRTGDVIVEINRQPVASTEEALAAARESTSGRLLLRVYTASETGGGTRYLVLERTDPK
jgi:serine protease Do